MFFLVGCGMQHEISLSDDLQEALEGTQDNNSEDDGDEAEDDTPGDTDDTTGGLEALNGADGVSIERFFMGTYSWVSTSYFNGEYQARCSQGFPNVVRLYSHSDTVIDWETSGGDLVSVSEIYEDSTLDNSFVFLDGFGRASVSVLCTCELEDAYFEYWDDRIVCDCNPSNSSTNCGIAYEKMGE